eukprot:3937208-Rhodomonas_salina.10
MAYQDHIYMYTEGSEDTITTAGELPTGVCPHSIDDIPASGSILTPSQYQHRRLDRPRQIAQRLSNLPGKFSALAKSDSSYRHPTW